MPDSSGRACHGPGRQMGTLGEDFTLAKETPELGLGGVGTVRGVANVAHLGIPVLGPEVTPDRPGGRFVGIGGSENITHAADHVLALEGKRNDWCFLHEGLHVGEEREAGNVGVVLIEQFVRSLEHLEPADAEARLEIAV